MSLIDMIEKAAGPGALQHIGARVGLSPEQLDGVIASIAPSLAPKLAAHADDGTFDGTIAATTPPAPGSAEAVAHGNDVLGSIFGSKDVSRSVAGEASTETGVSVDKIKAVLPQLASIAAVAFLTHRASAQGGLGLGGLFTNIGKDFVRS